MDNYYGLMDVNGNIPVEMAKEIAEIEMVIKNLTEKQKHIKETLCVAMRENNVLKVENDYIKVTYVPPTTQERIDSKELKKDLPEIYNTYCKISDKSDYVRIEVK